MNFWSLDSDCHSYWFVRFHLYTNFYQLFPQNYDKLHYFLPNFYFSYFCELPINYNQITHRLVGFYWTWHMNGNVSDKKKSTWQAIKIIAIYSSLKKALLVVVVVLAVVVVVELLLPLRVQFTTHVQSHRLISCHQCIFGGHCLSSGVPQLQT